MDYGVPQYVRFNVASLLDMRSSLNLSQKGFAEYLGVSKPLINYFERGGYVVKKRKYNHIARQLEWQEWK